MLEQIFQGFSQWAYGLVLESWQYFSNTLLDILNMDFSYLRTHVPVIDTIMQIMLAVGWALLLGNLVFQALKSMAVGLGFEGEDPKLLFTRTFVFSFLLLASPQICRLGLDMTQTIINILQVPNAVNVTFLDENAFSGLGTSWILIIIIGIIVMFKVFKMLLEIAERYVILGLLTICAPLAFGVGGSRSTSDIFTGWCRMFASMCFMMVSHVIFFKMLLSVFSVIPTGLDVLPWLVLVLTIPKVAKKVDAIITRIGLNPAITGDSLGSRLPGMLTMTILRAATKQVVQTAGQNAGGGAGGSSSKSPGVGGSGGGPKAGGPFGGRTSGRDKHKAGQTWGSQNASYQSSSTQQSSTAQPSGQNASAAFHSAAQGNPAQQESSARQSTPWAPEMGSIRPGAARQVPFEKQNSRQSAVPPGTRRAASHVRQASSGMAGIGAAAVSRQAGQQAGTASGTAGMAASSMRMQPSGSAQSPGTASGSRFAQSVRQSSRDGDTNLTQNASQQQNISTSSSSQGRQRSFGTAGTRYTARSPSTQTNSAAGTAGSNSNNFQQANRTHAPASGAVEPSARYGRNDAQRSSAVPSKNAAADRRTAQQERTASIGSATSKANGTAGIGPRPSSVAQYNRSPSKTVGRARSTAVPSGAAGGKRVNAAAAVQQEKAQSVQRQSSRVDRGGDGHVE